MILRLAKSGIRALALDKISHFVDRPCAEIKNYAQKLVLCASHDAAITQNHYFTK
jgi:hypothetical protein